MAVPRNYYNFFDVCKMEGIPEGTAKAATARGLEGIASIQALKPIGHLFKEFEKYVKGGVRKQYGILRSHYDYWKKHGEPPKLSPGRPPKYKNCAEIRLYLDQKLYDDFKAIVDKANSMSEVKVYYRDMIAVAVREFVDRRKHILDGDMNGNQEQEKG